MTRKSPPCCALHILELEDRSVPSTYVVSNTGDSGAGSLRQAILSANAHPGADKVRFDDGVLGTITLTSQVSVTGDTDLKGPGADVLTVSGGGTTRVLSIAAGANVGIKNLTIANGFVSGESGGGILNQGTLSLENSVVRGNTTDFPFPGGRGGGIENTGTLTVQRSSITGNRGNIDGGGLHNGAGGIAVLDHSTVSNNTCVGDGAGIRSEIGSTLTLRDSTVSGNSASGFGTGGIASGATLTIVNSTIADNTSAAAGLYFSSGSGDVVISGSTIRDNGPNATSGAGAGGIWSAASSTTKIRIEDTVIRNNTGGGGRSGGVYGTGTWEIVASTIRDNTGGSGGGLFLIGTLTATGSTFSGNTGTTGGVSVSGTATITDSTISDNTGVGVGGITVSTRLTLVRSTVSGNTATPAGTGPSLATGVGGVAMGNGQITNSTISGNTVFADQMLLFSGRGNAAGGILVRAVANGGATAIDNSTVAFNQVLNAPADIHTSGGVTVAKPFTTTVNFFTNTSVRNTIIAGNASNVFGPDVSGGFLSVGHNLLGVLNANANGFVASDLHGTDVAPLDPLLRPLHHNGGPTLTHALMPGSPAHNAGDNAGAPPTDQRGRDRIVDDTIDIGSVEARFHGGNDNNGFAGGSISADSRTDTKTPSVAGSSLGAPLRVLAMWPPVEWFDTDDLGDGVFVG
jgi:hypothetical protein